MGICSQFGTIEQKRTVDKCITDRYTMDPQFQPQNIAEFPLVFIYN